MVLLYCGLPGGYLLGGRRLPALAHLYSKSNGERVGCGAGHNGSGLTGHRVRIYNRVPGC